MAGSPSRRAIAASIATFSAVALIAATPGSPYHPVLPETQGNGPVGLLSQLLFLDELPHGVLIVDRIRRDDRRGRAPSC